MIGKNLHVPDRRAIDAADLVVRGENLDENPMGINSAFTATTYRQIRSARLNSRQICCGQMQVEIAPQPLTSVLSSTRNTGEKTTLSDLVGAGIAPAESASVSLPRKQNTHHKDANRVTMICEGSASDALETAALMTAATACLSVWATPHILSNDGINRCSRGIRVGVASVLCIWDLYCFVKLMSFIQKRHEDYLGISCTTYLLVYCFLILTVARGYWKEDPMTPIVNQFGGSFLAQIFFLLMFLPFGVVIVLIGFLPGIFFADLVGYGGCEVLSGVLLSADYDYMIAIIGAGIAHALAWAGCRAFDWYTNLDCDEEQKP